MSCTAGKCVCGLCGTSGKGDHEAATKRASAAMEQQRQRDAEHAMRREVSKPGHVLSIAPQ